MANRSFVVSLSSLVNSFLIFQNKLRIERKVTEISNHVSLTPSIRKDRKTQRRNRSQSLLLKVFIRPAPAPLPKGGVWTGAGHSLRESPSS